MRKSRWAAATGISSLVLLLAACGGSSSPTTAAGGGSAPASSGSAPASSTAAAATAASTASAKATSPHVTATPHHTAGPQPSSGADTSVPPVGTTVMIVQHSNLGYVLAEANGQQVVYTYGKDTKGGAPTCTGACAQTWLPVTGTPQAGPADTFPGTFTLVKGAGGVEQIAYNGYPLYILKGARPYATTGNGQGGLWHVVPLSASDIHA